MQKIVHECTLILYNISIGLCFVNILVYFYLFIFSQIREGSAGYLNNLMNEDTPRQAYGVSSLGRKFVFDQ